MSEGIAALVLTLTLGKASVSAAGEGGGAPPAAGHWLPGESAPALGQPLRSAPTPALVFGDGTGLPSGQGSAAQGAALYQSQCAACHGLHGEGRTAPELVGGEGPLSDPQADKTLATYWPYAPTLFDAIRRSMPPASPGRLSADELYALCAFLLSQNGLWPPGQPLDGVGLAGVRMPNRDGFVPESAP